LAFWSIKYAVGLLKQGQAMPIGKDFYAAVFDLIVFGEEKELDFGEIVVE
jgi:hypothetical protein